MLARCETRIPGPHPDGEGIKNRVVIISVWNICAAIGERQHHRHDGGGCAPLVIRLELNTSQSLASCISLIARLRKGRVGVAACLKLNVVFGLIPLGGCRTDCIGLVPQQKLPRNLNPQTAFPNCLIKTRMHGLSEPMYDPRKACSTGVKHAKQRRI
jgi:hypothetical protein